MKPVQLAILLEVLALGCAESHGSGFASGARSRAETGGAGAVGAGAAANEPHARAEAGVAGSTASGATLPASTGRGPASDAGGAMPAAVPGSSDAGAQSDREVWVGQTHGLIDVFCDRDPHGSVPAANAAPSVEREDRVLLVLDQAGESETTGFIQFGEGDVPSTPGDAPFIRLVNGEPPASSVDDPLVNFWLCSVQGPARGAQYPLHSAVRTADRLRFEIVPNDIWSAFCAQDKRTCHYEDLCFVYPATCSCLAQLSDRTGSCVEQAPARFEIDLAITADTIEGELPIGLMQELRLQRAR